MSDVVKLEYLSKYVALVTMQDRKSRNTFSNELLDGFSTCFNTINDNPEIKVVVITGFDNYFCCGGTKEELLKIYNKEAVFTDFAFYRFLLDCKVPTISAMQGHAIGGGLAFGCYADLIIMSEQSFYSANFMMYGFTPGMGSTYIIPKKLGYLLGTEMLMTAQKYHGGILKSRGASALIVDKKEVVAKALEIAENMADTPRTSLTLLKQHLTQDLKKELDAVIAKELKMHEYSFAQPEVEERILRLFGA